jgi:two-component sensor histidine kinase
MDRLDPLLKNRVALFWTLQLGGWLAYALSQYLGTLIYDTKYEHMAGYTTVIGIATISGFLLSLELRYIYRRLWTHSPRVVIGVALLSCYLFALIWRVIINSSYLQFTSDSMDWVMKSPLEFFANAMSSTYLLLCWTGIYFGIKYYEVLQQQREATLRAATLAQEAQLKMLRYQLNPHFLFNTLNAISTLILDNENRTANQTIMRLSEFLRYTLDQDPMKKVTLRQELDALNLYLGIEKLRFGDRLRLEFEVDERAESALVPSLLLQPLVENAMKYAIAPREEGGAVTIIAGIEGGGLRLAVVDDGPGLPPAIANANARGVGLRNTRDRLKVLYGGAHTVEVADAKPGLRVEMRLPLEI